MKKNMKKAMQRIFKALVPVLMLSILLASGCAKAPAGGITQEDYDALAQEFAQAGEAIEKLEGEKVGLEAELAEALEALQESGGQEEPASSSGPVPGASLLSEAAAVLQLLKDEDLAALSLYIDPAAGLRVSAYQYVDTASDVVLSPGDVAGWSSYPSTVWGAYDGIGDPIQLSGIDYFHEFVYDEDYVQAPYIGQNTVLSSGNTLNNIATAYPGDAFVEFYFDVFNPTYEGMDWSSLTLVMRQIGGQWHLVGLVNGQWTI